MKEFKISNHKSHGRHIRQDQAAAMVESAAIFSRHRVYRTDVAITRWQLEAAAQRLIQAAGAEASVEGIIPGHLKLLVKAGESGMVLSMTRMDTIDESFFGGWEVLEDLTEYELTVNFLLLTSADFDEATIMGEMEPQKIASEAFQAAPATLNCIE